MKKISLINTLKKTFKTKKTINKKKIKICCKAAKLKLKPKSKNVKIVKK